MRMSLMSQTSASTPAWLTEDPVPLEHIFGPKYTDIESQLIERWRMCHTIARNAWHSGLLANPMFVNKHYRHFKLWYAGGLTTAQLVKITGVNHKRQPPELKEGE
jgi:hypothetical protein